MALGWWDADKLRLCVQALVALAVLGGATYLGSVDVLNSEAISVLYGAALGAVGAGAVGGARSGATTQTFTQAPGPSGTNGGTLTTHRKSEG